MKKTLAVLATTLTLGLPAMAHAISCAGVTDVTALGAGGCDFGGFNFNRFAVSESAGFDVGSVTVGIGAGSQATNTTANLNFRLTTPGPGPGDILILYGATGIGSNVITGVDLQNNAVTAPVTIGELVCRPPLSLGETCSPENRLAALAVGAGQSAQATFAPTDQVIIFKDIAVGEGGFISDFTNSHALGALTPVPEPATLALLSTGFGLVAGWRALRRRRTVVASL